jgi:hypothetical protein
MPQSASMPVLALALVGAIQPTFAQATASSPQGGIHAAYALLAPTPDRKTVPLARLIVAAGRGCPRLAAKGGLLPMTARTNPNPDTFPVEVCEAVYPFGEAVRVAGTWITLPAVTPDPKRIVVFGDTGCYDNPSFQPCDDPATWPFGSFAAAAAEERPELVIHVGDYNYRGTPGTIEVHGTPRKVYDAGDNAPQDPRCQLQVPYVSQNGAGSSNPDGWEAWRADFFTPAAPLLAQAPWVAARGNHELCSRAGPGYFYFLDPHSKLLGGELRCPVQRNGSRARSNLLFVAPYQVDLGAARLTVLDSANACDAYPNFTHIYARQFGKLQELGTGHPTWLVTHRPIWGLDDGDNGAAQPINVALQQGLRQGGQGTLPREVRLILSGHMHRFEAVSFPASARPPQLVIGNSGIGLSDPTEPPRTGPFRAELDGRTAQGLVANVFGYLDMRLRPDGHWRGQVVNPSLPGPKKVLASCGPSVLHAAGQVCVPGPAFPNGRQAAE